jgi:hypothetical protein
MICYLDLDPKKRYVLTRFNAISLTSTYTQYPTAQTVKVKLEDEEQPIWLPVGGIKPEGLWYAFGQSWIDYKLLHGKLDASFVFELSVDNSKMVVLRDAQDIENFNDTYRVGDDGKIINWLEVSKQYDGIELFPFSPNHSGLHWYQTFDVPSGCIWNLKNIRSVRLVKDNL